MGKLYYLKFWGKKEQREQRECKSCPLAIAQKLCDIEAELAVLGYDKAAQLIHQATNAISAKMLNASVMQRMSMKSHAA
jgi:hypothetical protein